MLKGFITCSGTPASSADSITSRRVFVSRDDRVRVRDVRRLSARGEAELENKAPTKYDDACELPTTFIHRPTTLDSSQTRTS